MRSAAASALITTVEPDGSGVLHLRFGAQTDVQPIVASGDGLTEEMVAAYIAKYVSKGDLPGLVLDVPVRSLGHIGASRLTAHGKALAYACWDLGGRGEYEHLRLRAWAHQLGWRGHPTTKSGVYSTTYGRLRGERAAHRQAANGEDFDPDDTVTESSWVFDFQGHTPGEAMFAAWIADDIAAGRAANRQARDEIERGESTGCDGRREAMRGASRNPAYTPAPGCVDVGRALFEGCAVGVLSLVACGRWFGVEVLVWRVLGDDCRHG